MRKAILISVALVPVFLGLLAASDAKPKRGLMSLMVGVAAFELVYAFLLYYVWLRLSD